MVVQFSERETFDVEPLDGSLNLGTKSWTQRQ